MPFNPDYDPSGIRNKANGYFARQNHVKLAKNDVANALFVSGIVTLSMSGLDTSAPTNAATPGDHLSISVEFPSGVTSWVSQAWGIDAYGDDTYGTGSNPTDYSASDGQTLLWEGVGDNGDTYRASAPIRSDVATFDDTVISFDSTNYTFDEAA